MINRILFFLCHSVYSVNGVYDPNYSITSGFLQKYFPATLAIRHSLLEGGESRFYPKGIENGYFHIYWLGRLPAPLRYIAEVFVNFLILFYFRPKVVLAIDPLCAFVPLVLKRVGIVRSVIFITPDFSERRFKNALLNWIYYHVDGFCTRRADENLCVSKKIIERKAMQYSVNPERFFHLPNIPHSEVVSSFKGVRKTPCSFVYVGNISTQIDFSTAIEIVKRVQSFHPETSFHIVGDGDYLKTLKRRIYDSGVNHVMFHGILSLNETLRIISQSEFGIALYNGTLSYDRYRDSCKIREYQALSCIPIISSVVQSNADEIRQFGSGLFIDDVEVLVKLILDITQDALKAEHIRECCQLNYRHYSKKFEEYRELVQRRLDAPVPVNADEMG